MGAWSAVKSLAAATACLALAAGCNGGSANPASAPLSGDAFLGPANAKIVIEEYAAPSCPICKRWHDEIFPRLKSQFIDAGKVKFVLKEFPSHNPPVDAAVFALARCSGQANYFKVIDGAFAKRDEIEKAAESPSGARPALVDLAGTVGIKGDAVETCIHAPEATQRIFAMQDEGAKRGVTGTPTLFINGQLVSEADTFSPDAFLAQVEAAVAKGSGVAPAAPASTPAAPLAAPAPAKSN